MRMRFSRVLAGVLALQLVGGCTSTQRFGDYSPEKLREAIRAGEVVQPGDRVAVRSLGRGEVVFVVARIDQEAIRGTGFAIPIDEIVALEKREFSASRTAGAGLAGYAIVMMLVAAAVFGQVMGDLEK